MKWSMCLINIVINLKDMICRCSLKARQALGLKCDDLIGGLSVV